MAEAKTFLGFIGAGNMAEAIARGILRAALYRPAELAAADPSPDRQRLFTSELQILCLPDSAQVAARSRILLLAVKPQMITPALEQIRPVLRPDALVISIVAAITSGFIEQSLGGTVRVIRVMPNTPMLVGAGMSALARGAHATEEDLALAERLFNAGGRSVRVREELMDAVTAVSGSGPAYVFYLAEALAAAGTQLGLSAAEASLLARQTVIGAAQLLAQAQDAPAELRRKVTSPGGTTQAAITALEAGDFFALLTRAVAAAERRGKELSR